ncbi:sulfatase [Radiobacillus sp. PE A8.2]|uniref:sulfatase family protein n=1 Tax=Radiobacillus sp. PE A8.2 TaxID=3380349 RepID=UPI00388F8BC1
MDNRPKNVVWVLVDQMRAQAMSHRGDPNINTPNLDKLSVDGVSFNSAVSGAPLCSPFRGSLLTGKYPHQSSVPGLGSPMSTEIPTVAHAFNESGYNTCWIGKWHLDGERPELDMSLAENHQTRRVIPEERRGGFQDWWAYENNNNPFNCTIHTGDNENTQSYRLPGYETDDLTDLLIDYMTTQKEQEDPFFAVLSVQPPHNPYLAPAENMAKFNPASMQLRPNVPESSSVKERARRELAGYYAAIDRIDFNLGRILKALRNLEIDQDTYIIFFSDHGDMLGSHGHFRKTVPWEESIRIPFIVGGGEIEAQNSEPRENDYLINHVDIAPTTLGLCGINKPKGMVGYDYSKSILHPGSDTNAPDSAYIGLPVPSDKGYSVDRPYRGVITQDGWKYTSFENGPWQMYNLNEDPYEQVNLAIHTRHRPMKKKLNDRLKKWVESTGDDFQLPNI